MILLYVRSQTLLHRWAQDQQYSLVSAQLRLLFHGPYWLTAKGQFIYRVTILDRQGRRHQGWLRCGSYWWGALANKVEIRWDDDL